MRILGIDPGTRITGYGLIVKTGHTVEHVDNGLIVNPLKSSAPLKLQKIFEHLSILIGDFKPDVIALEDVFVSQNVKSSLKLGQARGVVMLAAAQAGIPVVEYSPAKVKQTVASFGQATKEQIQKMVKLHLKLKEPAAEDASDALAVALCHAQTQRWGT